MEERYTNIFATIYNKEITKRILILWLMIHIFIWVIFSIGYITHPQNWLLFSRDHLLIRSTSITEVFYNELLILLLIIIGNLTVRFGIFTPGLLLLFLKSFAMAWTFGTDSAVIVYTNFLSASYQYFLTWIWESTAYVLACAITLPKSKYITNRIFYCVEPVKNEKLTFTAIEKVVLLIAVVLIIIGAGAETYLKWGFIK